MKATSTALLSGALLVSAASACSVSEDACSGLAPEPGIICTVAGTGERAFNGDGLDPRDTDFHSLSSVRPGPEGALYVVDGSNQRIRALTPQGVRTVAGNGVHERAHLGTQATDSPLEQPVDLAFDSDGRLIIVSLHDPRLLRVEHDGTLKNLAGYGDYGDFGDGGSALNAAFLEPTGIAIAEDGTIYIADGLAARVRAILPDNTIVAIAGTGEYGYSGDGGPAVEATLEYPTALALDPEGRLLIADSVNHAVRRVEADGTIVTIAGTGEKGFSGDGGPAAQAELNSPEGLAVAEDGRIYLSDTRNHRIRCIDPEGTIQTLAGSGESGWQGDGADALSASFYSPVRLSLGGSTLFIADLNNERVRAVGLP